MATALSNINQDWKWGFGVERQTDDLYDRRYDIDSPSGGLGGLFASQPRQLLTQLYTTGQTEDFYLESGLYSFQGLRDGDNDATFPKVAPAFYAQKNFDFGKAGQLATDFSAVGLFRDAAEDRTPPAPRSDTHPRDGARHRPRFGLRRLGHAVGFRSRPRAAALRRRPRRFLFVRQRRRPQGQRGSQPRFLGVAGAQVSLPFVRRGKNVDVFVEPILMVAYGSPDANDLANPAALPTDTDYGATVIPNEDSLVFEADESNLFKPNPINGYDLWEGGARAAVGISASATVGKNIEFGGLIRPPLSREADPALQRALQPQRKEVRLRGRRPPQSRHGIHSGLVRN